MVAEARLDERQSLHPGGALGQPAIMNNPGEFGPAFGLQFVMVQHRVGLIDMACRRICNDPFNVVGQVVRRKWRY